MPLTPWEVLPTVLTSDSLNFTAFPFSDPIIKVSLPSVILTFTNLFNFYIPAIDVNLFKLLNIK